MKKGFAVAAALAVVFGAVLPSGNSAGAVVTSGKAKCWANSNGDCYHWARTANPFTLKVENDVSSTWQGYFTQALDDWTNTTDHPTPVVLKEATEYKPSGNCGALNGEVRVCNKSYGFNGWLGIASIWSRDGVHITAGTVKLNDSYFNTTTYNTPAWRNLVSCQELAHTLGLDHEDVDFSNTNLGSCMDYTSNPLGPPSNEKPAPADYTVLNEMYTHLDFTSTVAAATGSTSRGNANGLGNDEDALPPGAGPRDGDVFVKHLGNGVTIVSHVFWADRGRP